MKKLRDIVESSADLERLIRGQPAPSRSDNMTTPGTREHFIGTGRRMYAFSAGISISTDPTERHRNEQGYADHWDAIKHHYAGHDHHEVFGDILKSGHKHFDIDYHNKQVNPRDGDSKMNFGNDLGAIYDKHKQAGNFKK